MKIKSILGGAIAAQLMLAGSVTAAGLDRSDTQDLISAGMAYLAQRTPRDKMRVPGPRNPAPGYVQLAQVSDDPRLLQLEEQIRQLNGQIEELNFQVLQMQDQMRKMQEDNEFRFQQLEGGSAGGGQKSETIAPGDEPMDQQLAETDVETIIASPDGANTGSPTDNGSLERGAPPRTLGTITFDAQGNPIQSGSLPGVEVGPPGTDNTDVAALPPSSGPDELYRNSYELVLSGDYAMAEAGFRDHIARYPGDPRAADARYWLGEALLGQQRYREAAQVFLEANRDYPDARKAPESLLKLGISLAAMKQRDVACATLAEVSKRYPQASPAILQRAKEERANASC